MVMVFFFYPETEYDTDFEIIYNDLIIIVEHN